ncbi:P-loop NTPase fold protein [Nocardia vinacea]|uniref:KAP family P-loop NTPase fold protein n=1 Tax=Nocardia vinacea TaxID=96468 RepID=UPI0034009F79
MWADNEADIDLLGFDFLVDTLYVAVTEPRLLPLTVGLLGDWGSGKSSLMAITRAELERVGEDTDTEVSPYLCVSFSPWQYEDYDDVKIALITAILDTVDTRIEADDDARQEQVTRLRRCGRSLRRWGRRLGRGGLAAVPAAVPMLLQGIDPGMDPEIAKLAAASATSAATAGARRLQEPEEPDLSDEGRIEPITDVGEFRDEFEDLVRDLPGVESIVVFIDDLDRCLPETVVDTFEAIRLFVNTSKTAYVIAANQQVVEAAIDSRYPELVREGVGLGANYLEKMLQLKVTIPQLSAPEADTYMNLLLAQLRLDDTQFAKVVAKTREQRASGNLQVAFNAGVCGDVLDDVPAALARDLEWAASVSEVLGSGLRGNPRQLKRFLNNLMLKHRSAKRRRIDLELPVLAKLMALEEQHFTEFRRLFDWQLHAAGPIPELGLAEAAALAASAPPPTDERSSRGTGRDGTHRGSRSSATEQVGQAAESEDERSPQAPPLSEDLQAWIDKPYVHAWLRLSPSLAGVDLRRYFTYSRDKLSLGVAVTRLQQHLQELLTRVQTDVDNARQSVCAEIAALGEGERAQLVEALLETLVRQPAGPAFVAAVDLVDRAPDVAPAVCEALMRIPPSAVPIKWVARTVQRLPKDDPAVVALFERWAGSDVTGLKTVVTQARQAQARSRRR